MEEPGFLVVGLGNPGPEYESTPHNLGFLTVDRLAERNDVRVSRPECRATVGDGKIQGQTVLLAKPQTFMNLSGSSVQGLLLKYSVPVERLILVYDDLDLPWTTLRIRVNGSAGGHHGVEDVIRATGSQNFPRVRLGIHPGHPVRDGARYVLAPFKSGQLKELDELLSLAAESVESMIALGVEKAMTKHNRRAQG